MNQIVQMFMESNSRMKKIINGGLHLDQVAALTREFEGQIKLFNAVVSAYSITSKNQRTMKGLNRMNIMDETTAVDLMLGDPEVDKVKCPLQDHLITRSECLDYSGHHSLDDCKGCEIGKATKDLLLPSRT